MTITGGPTGPKSFGANIGAATPPAEVSELTWGELKAFVEAHGVTDDAVLLTWDENHEVDAPLVSAAVSIFMNGRQEVVLRS